MDPLRDRDRWWRALLLRVGIVTAILAALASLRALDRGRDARHPAPPSMATDPSVERALAAEAERAVREGPPHEAVPIPPEGLRAFAEHWDASVANGAEAFRQPRAVEPPGIEARRRVAPPLAVESGRSSPMRHAAPRPDDARARFAPLARDLAPSASR